MTDTSTRLDADERVFVEHLDSAAELLDRVPSEALAHADDVGDVLGVVSCPECGRPAAVEWRTQLDSTDGPLEHLKIRCLDRHWFFLPADMLADAPSNQRVDATEPHPTDADPRPHDLGDQVGRLTRPMRSVDALHGVAGFRCDRSKGTRLGWFGGKEG